MHSRLRAGNACSYLRWEGLVPVACVLGREEGPGPWWGRGRCGAPVGLGPTTVGVVGQCRTVARSSAPVLETAQRAEEPSSQYHHGSGSSACQKESDGSVLTTIPNLMAGIPVVGHGNNWGGWEGAGTHSHLGQATYDRQPATGVSRAHLPALSE